NRCRVISWPLKDTKITIGIWDSRPKQSPNNFRFLARRKTNLPITPTKKRSLHKPKTVFKIKLCRLRLQKLRFIITKKQPQHKRISMTKALEKTALKKP